jgi:hypothetical protein
MPRRTHPRARHRHDRAHIRFHRDRWIAKRVAVARLVLGDDDLRSAWREQRGRATDVQAWVGCRRAHCLLCHWEKLVEGQANRRRAEREWCRHEEAEW